MATEKNEMLDIYVNGMVQNELGPYSNWDENHSHSADDVFSTVSPEKVRKTAREVSASSF